MKEIRIRLPHIRADRWPYVWAAIVTLLILAVGGFIINQTKANLAAERAQSTAVCVNAVLAERDRLTGLLHDADVARVRRQKRAETIKTQALGLLAHATSKREAGHAFRLYIRGERAFQRTLTRYLTESDSIHRAQLRHPLGHCG